MLLSLRLQPSIPHLETSMPVFHAHIPARRFSREQKHALADALNQSLVQGLGIPEGDRFIMISEHGDDELFLHPTFMEMQRSSDAMIITVLFGAHRPLEDKRKVTAAINTLVTEALGISPDDIFIALVPVPTENFSFGKGELQLADSAPRW
jgi:phenylpyruvate tautomerase PptA (4-oxalocrotonate tautomerase family)